MDVVKTAQRVCEVFEFFQERQQPQRLRDFVDELGYPTSSAAALLKSLVQLGYLDYDLVTRTYLPTLRMPAMVGWIERVRFGNGSVLAAMQQLHAVTQERVSLSVQSDLQVQYLYQFSGEPGRRAAPQKKGLRPLARSGLGWLLLSAMGDEAVRHLVRRINSSQRTGDERVNVEVVLDQVSEIRRKGFVFAKHGRMHGAGIIGMLVPRAPHERQLALGVHGPVSRLEEKQTLILQGLRAASTAVGPLGPGNDEVVRPRR